jgi:hypothetical protein
MHFAINTKKNAVCNEKIMKKDGKTRRLRKVVALTGRNFSICAFSQGAALG